MLTNNQILEIREHLESSSNPLFLYDNDLDGLASFLILRRFLGRGKGEVIKASNSVKASDFQFVEKTNPDTIFVLDKPSVEKGFLEEATKKNLKVIQIDHHIKDGETAEFYYNPMEISKTNEPVSFLCQKIANRKEDVWVSLIGCISDCYLPEFVKDFKEKELLDYNYKTAFDILYNTQFGKIIKILDFALRDSPKKVKSMVDFLINAKSINELVGENEKNKEIFQRAEKISHIYSKLLKEVESLNHKDIIFYKYSGNMGLNRDLSNELAYKHPNKKIIIAYIKDNNCKISLRWMKGDIRTPALKAIKTIEGATGGGHEHAPGIQLSSSDLETFKNNIFKELE